MSTNNSKLKGRFWCSRRNWFGTELLWNNLACAITVTPYGLNPRSIDRRNIELNYTLKLARVIHAAVFGKTWKTANFNKRGLMKFNFAASRNTPKFSQSLLSSSLLDAWWCLQTKMFGWSQKGRWKIKTWKILVSSLCKPCDIMLHLWRHISKFG